MTPNLRTCLAIWTACVCLMDSLTVAKNPFPHGQQDSNSVFRDLRAFNEAAGTPRVAINFDDLPADSNLDGCTQCGVRFQAVHAPLIVVRGDETYTPTGFENLSNPAKHALCPTTGEQLLSPGGPALAPGPNPAIEDDDIILVFDPPVAAVGFDHISQYADGLSYTNVEVIDISGHRLHAGTLEIGRDAGRWEQRFEPLQDDDTPTADFWGFVSHSANIREIRIQEHDDNNVCPDSNIGIDSLRFAPSACAISADLNGDDLCDRRDVQILMNQWGGYEHATGNQVRWRQADFNRDSRIDSADLTIMLDHIG